MLQRTKYLAIGIAAAAVVAAAAPAHAAPPTYYVALGDSLARGIGAPGGQGYVDDVFAFEQQSHPGLQLVNLSCSGETTGTMINGGTCSYTTGSQLGDAEAFLTAHAGQISFITIDIGGNDLAFCFSPIPLDLTYVKSALPPAAANLPTILSRLRAAAGAVPIVGLKYYDPFLAYWLLGDAGPQAAHDSVKLLKYGNAGLKKVYRKFRAGIADGEKTFLVLKFALRGSWAGQTVPVNVAQECLWTLMCTQNDIHANGPGHAALAAAFEPVIDKLLMRQ